MSEPPTNGGKKENKHGLLPWQQAVSETNTIDEKESPKTNKDVSETNTLWKAPKKQKMMTIRKGVQKNEVIVRKLRKKMHFFVGPFGLYLQNSYFLVSTLLFRAFL